MICKRCVSEINNKLIFCPKCGLKISEMVEDIPIIVGVKDSGEKEGPMGEISFNEIKDEDRNDEVAMEIENHTDSIKYRHNTVLGKTSKIFLLSLLGLFIILGIVALKSPKAKVVHQEDDKGYWVIKSYLQAYQKRDYQKVVDLLLNIETLKPYVGEERNQRIQLLEKGEVGNLFPVDDVIIPELRAVFLSPINQKDKNRNYIVVLHKKLLAMDFSSRIALREIEGKYYVVDYMPFSYLKDRKDKK